MSSQQQMSLDDFYRRIFEPLKLRSRSARTRDLYGISLRHLRTFLKRVPTLDDLNDDTVSAYLGWFRQQGRAAASVNKERNNVLAMWRFAARKRLVDRWPDVDPEIEPERVPNAWTEADVFKLFDYVRKLEGFVGFVPESSWWMALLLVIWDSGERIGAVMGMTWRDVDLVGGFVVCRAESRKGGRSDRLYKIAEDTVQALTAIRPIVREDNRNVFFWPYNAKYLWPKFGKILERAKLPHDARSKFHRIRRTVATYCEAAGGNATELLGHSRRSVTLRYIDPRIVGQHFATEYLFRPITPK